jgi:hypothetical protein
MGSYCYGEAREDVRFSKAGDGLGLGRTSPLVSEGTFWSILLGLGLCDEELPDCCWISKAYSDWPGCMLTTLVISWKQANAMNLGASRKKDISMGACWKDRMRNSAM